MDYSELKNLMRTYLGDVVDSEELRHLFVDDPDVTYRYNYYSSSGLTHLHKCVILTRKHPNLNNYLEEYLETYGNVDQVNYHGKSALHYASCCSNTDSTERTVEILINANANVNLQDNNGLTALHNASYYSNTNSTERTVEILINANANVNLQDNDGWTALHAAIYFDTTSTEDTIKQLILANADVFNIKNSYDKTPYDLFPKDLIERFQIDQATQTIGIKSGRFTKCAKK